MLFLAIASLRCEAFAACEALMHDDGVCVMDDFRVLRGFIVDITRGFHWVAE